MGDGGISAAGLNAHMPVGSKIAIVRRLYDIPHNLVESSGATIISVGITMHSS